MAVGDPLGLVDDPEKEKQVPDYLGKDSPLAFKGQPALPVTGAAAFGSPSAPAGPGGPGPLPEGLSGGGGPAQSGYAQLAARLMDSGSDLFRLFGGGEPTRGDTGGTSLSDQVRSSTELGGPADPASQVSGGELALGAEGGADAAGSVAANAGYEGLLEAFQGQGFEGLLAELGGAGAVGAAGGMLWPIIESFWKGDDAFNMIPGMGPTNRGPSVAHEIRTQMKDLPVIFNQLKEGAVDPKTFAAMSDEDLAKAFQLARIGYGASNGLAPMFGESGRTEAGVTHPDIGDLAGASNQLQGVDFFNMVAAQDMLNQRGYKWPSADPDGPNYDPYTLPLDFGTALQVTAGGAGIPRYGSNELTALAPWMPLYKDERMIDATYSDNEGSHYAQRAPSSPEEYLSTIGADPKLAAQLGPLIEGAQPGQYMDTLEKIYSILNPDLANSMFGQLRGSLQGGQPGDAGAGAEAAGSGGGFGDVARTIFAPGVPPPFDPNNAGDPGLGGGEQFAAQQLGVEIPQGVA